jgi:hypothetical protein
MKFLAKIFGTCATVALTGMLIQACGSDTKDDDTSTGTGTTAIQADVKAITDKVCATSGCHAVAQGSVAANVFTDAAKFKASDSLASINSGSMPPDATTWTTAEKAKVVEYLGTK